MENLEFLKEALGEELLGQVGAALEGAEGIRLANVADGSFIPKDKFDRERTAHQQYKAQVAELQQQIAAMQQSSGDIEALKAQLAAANQAIADNAAKMQQTRMHYHMIDKAREAGARDPEMLVRLLDGSKISEVNGAFVGVDEQVKALQESAAYLFAAPAGRAGGFDPNVDLGSGKITTNTMMNNAIRRASGRG